MFANEKLAAAAASGTPVNMAAIFSQLTLDIIGKAVFNYDFNALTTDSPLIQVGKRGRVHPGQYYNACYCLGLQPYLSQAHILPV